MKGFVIEQVRNPRGRDAGTRGPRECPYIYYVIATTQDEAMRLVPTEQGNHVLATYESHEDFRKAPARFNSDGQPLVVESFDKETARVVTKLLLCAAV
jgi:hypothetical protein